MPRTIAQRGPRPQPLWGSFPLSETVILLGIVLVAIGIARGAEGGTVAIAAGVGLCALAVLEITAREHFTGYRSHVLLLALLAMVIFHTVMVLIVGESWSGPLAALADLAVLALTAGGLLKAFRRASRSGPHASRLR